jgi:hypothetical protein
MMEEQQKWQQDGSNNIEMEDDFDLFHHNNQNTQVEEIPDKQRGVLSME